MKNIITALLLLTFLIPLNALAAVGDQEIRFYRYKDESGNLIMKNILPADQAGKGYEILDQMGRVIEVVEPAPTEEDLAKLTQAQKDEMERKKRAEEQEIYDLELLRKYSFVSDIEAERKRAIDQLNIRVSILKGNLNGIRSELQAEYDKAAEVERKGGKLPEAMQKRISDLEAQLSATENMLDIRRKSIAKEDERYQTAIDRFKEIQLIRKGKKPQAQSQP